MTMEALKRELVAEIINIENPADLDLVRETIAQISKRNDLLRRLSKPRRKKTILEDIIREQNYPGFDRAAFDELINKLDIHDDIEEVLALSRT